MDKKVLQEELARYIKDKPESERGIKGFVNVKASLLVDGEGLGLEQVREGTEERPAVGYTIQRRDVGRWMFERAVEREVKGEYLNKGVVISY